MCLRLALFFALILVACEGEPSNSDSDLSPADTQRADSAADTGAPDTRSGFDTAPTPDLDEGPKELVNGASVRFGHVVDGDTLDVLVGNIFPARYSVRLLGLSAPECLKEKVGSRFQCVSDDEFYGLASRNALLSLVGEPTEAKTGIATCDGVAVGEWCPTDNFDRHLIYIELDGVDVATEMARGGHGFAYTSFEASKRADICAAEYEAQDAQRGMWASGTVSGVISRMSSSTQNWYNGHHDTRCDEALGR